MSAGRPASPGFAAVLTRGALRMRAARAIAWGLWGALAAHAAVLPSWLLAFPWSLTPTRYAVLVALGALGGALAGALAPLSRLTVARRLDARLGGQEIDPKQERPRG